MGRKRREPLKKKINPTYYVFCEGETEQEYVSLLRSEFRIPIQIKSSVSGNKITDRYIRSYLKGRAFIEKDQIFSMYDLDVAGMLDRLSLIDNVILLVSNPCIEL